MESNYLVLTDLINLVQNNTVPLTRTVNTYIDKLFKPPESIDEYKTNYIENNKNETMMKLNINYIELKNRYDTGFKQNMGDLKSGIEITNNKSKNPTLDNLNKRILCDSLLLPATNNKILFYVLITECLKYMINEYINDYKLHKNDIKIIFIGETVSKLLYLKYLSTVPFKLHVKLQNEYDKYFSNNFDLNFEIVINNKINNYDTHRNQIQNLVYFCLTYVREECHNHTNDTHYYEIFDYHKYKQLSINDILNEIKVEYNRLKKEQIVDIGFDDVDTIQDSIIEKYTEDEYVYNMIETVANPIGGPKINIFNMPIIIDKINETFYTKNIDEIISIKLTISLKNKTHIKNYLINNKICGIYLLKNQIYEDKLIKDDFIEYNFETEDNNIPILSYGLKNVIIIISHRIIKIIDDTGNIINNNEFEKCLKKLSYFMLMYCIQNKVNKNKLQNIINNITNLTFDHINSGDNIINIVLDIIKKAYTNISDNSIKTTTLNNFIDMFKYIDTFINIELPKTCGVIYNTHTISQTGGDGDVNNNKYKYHKYKYKYLNKKNKMKKY